MGVFPFGWGLSGSLERGTVNSESQKEVQWGAQRTGHAVVSF